MCAAALVQFSVKYQSTTAILVKPDQLSTVITALRIAAKTWGVAADRARQLSSRNVTSRTQCSLLLIRR